MQQSLLELFNGMKKSKEKNEYKEQYGKVLSMKEKDGLLKTYHDLTEEIRSIIKKAIPSCSLLNDEDIKEIEFDNGIKSVVVYTPIINLDLNFKAMRRAFKKWGTIDDIFEVDGDELYEAMEESIFKKIRSLGFKEEGSSFYFVYKKNDRISFSIDENFEKMNLSLDVAYLDNLQESVNVMTLNDNEAVTEAKGIMAIFNKRKKDVENSKPLPKKIQSREYETEEVKRDLRDIINHTTKLMKTDYKDFINKGMSTVAFNYSYYDDGLVEEDEIGETFESGKSFTIFEYDLWDYPSKESPRTILGDEGDHPVYQAANKLVKELKEYIDGKYKNKYKIDCYGDWDNGPYVIILV